jgi:hypothetical protein
MPGMDHILSKGFLATGSSAYTFGQVVQQVNLTTGPLATINQAQCQICPTSAGTAGANSVVLGVCQENLDLVKVQTGKAIIGVAIEGNCKVVWDGTGTPAVGSYIVPSGTVAGQVKFVSSVTTFQGFAVVGTPLTLPAAANDFFDISLAIGDRI